MTAIEVAEKKSRWRAVSFLLLAVLTLAVMVVDTSGRGTDFTQGLWFGLMLGSALNLLPWKRLLRPNDEVFRLMDDEGTRENRRLSSTIGFWAAVIAALGLGLFSRYSDLVDAWLVGQLVATAAMVAAMVSFGLLELRAAR
jgi:hypothetical protein